MNAHVNCNYVAIEGLLYWKGSLVIPSTSTLIQQVLREYHNSPICGHSGIARTLARIIAQFYWPNMKNDINELIQTCAICQ